jgi:hypothetical protein
MEDSFKDTQTFYDLDFSFHIGVAEAANNRALLEIVKLLVDKAHSHIGFMDDPLSISMPFNVEKAVRTAREIVSHIKTGGKRINDDSHHYSKGKNPSCTVSKRSQCIITFPVIALKLMAKMLTPC